MQLGARVEVVPLDEIVAAHAERVGDLVEAVAVARPVEDALAPLVAERAIGDRDQDGVVVGSPPSACPRPSRASSSSLLASRPCPCPCRRDRRFGHDDRRPGAQLGRVLDAVQAAQLARRDAARARHVVQRLAEAQHARCRACRLRARLVDVGRRRRAAVPGGTRTRVAPAVGRRAARAAGAGSAPRSTSAACPRRARPSPASSPRAPRPRS